MSEDFNLYLACLWHTLVCVQIMSFQLCIQPATPRMCRILQVKVKGYQCVCQNFSLWHGDEVPKQIQMTYIKSTVQNWSRVLVLHPHGVGYNIEETDSAVPGGNQQELGCAGAELDSRDAVLWSLVQLVLIWARHLHKKHHRVKFRLSKAQIWLSWALSNAKHYA